MARMKTTSRIVVGTAVWLSATGVPGLGQGLGNFRIEVVPPNPDDSTPVTVTIAEEFPDDCYVVCDTRAQWVGSSQFEVDWHVLNSREPEGLCLEVVTPLASLLLLGTLEPSEYGVTATLHITPWDGVCAEGTVQGQTETTFRVTDPIPTVSGWGLIVMGLSMLVVGTVCVRRRFTRVPMCVPFLFAIPGLGQDPNLGAERHPEHLLVRFNPGTSRETRLALHADIGAVELKRYRHVSELTLVNVPVDRWASALVEYRTTPHVLYVEPDYQIELAVTPNDEFFNYLWGLNNTGSEPPGAGGTPDADIDAVETWDLWTGDPEFRIAVIDTGVDYNHPDLADNIWTNQAELNGVPGVDDDRNGWVDDVHGYNFVDSYGHVDPLDDRGHGTHVAGTIGAVGNNSVGVVGVNWRCKIVALKIFPASGAASISDAIEAMEYVIDNNIKVSNNSYGGPLPFSQAWYDVIQASEAIGHIFVAAAGNGSNDNDVSPHYPSAFNLPNIMAVAATDNDDVLASFSNYGATSVDLGAPGVNICSTWRVPIGGCPSPDSCTTSTDTCYRSVQGTSMACPHVAGVVGLMMSRYPNWTYQQIRDRILSTVRPVPSLNDITVTEGVVNAYNALDCNENGIDDECDLDCGAPGGPCDVTGCGQSFDCDANGIPDDCEGDCNNNGLQDSCDIASGFSEDCDSNGVPDECDDCNGNGIIDACDVDCAALGGSCNVPGCGASNNCNGNCVPDECECSAIAVPEPPIAEPGGVGKNRYFSFVPGNPGCRTAIQVYIELLPNGYGFEAFEGMVMWVDHPADVCESSGGVNPPCAPPGTFKGARLTCDPVYQDWSSIGLMHVYDDEIVPSAGDDLFSTQAVYTVRAIHDGCGKKSAPYVIIMSQWGDITGGWDGISWTGPDGVVDLDDIDAVVAKFQDWLDAVSKTRADLAWDVPDRVVNFTDIGRAVDAYNGQLYPYDGPESCP